MRRLDVWSFVWITAQVTMMAAAVMLLVGCSSVRRTERSGQSSISQKRDSVWVIRRDTIWNERVLRDSVIVRDSVVVWMKGDSVVGRDGWHEVRVIRVKADSVSRVSDKSSGRMAEKKDSVDVKKETEIVKEKRGSAIWSWFWGVLCIGCCISAFWEWWKNRNKQA